MSVYSGGRCLQVLRSQKCPARHLRQYNKSAVSVSEYTDTPQYPPILNTSKRATWQRKKDTWHHNINNLATVEQKMVELNLPKYYGYWSLGFKDVRPKILGYDFCRYATRTHIHEEEGGGGGLPMGYYDDVRPQAETLIPMVVDKVEQLIQLNFTSNKVYRGDKTVRATRRHQTENFLIGLHRVIAGTLGSVPHIEDSMLDLRPRVEAFWFLGGIPPDNMLKKTRKNFTVTKEYENDPIDRPIQGTSTPVLGLRVTDGLPEVVPWDDPLATSATLPKSVLDPRAYGYKFAKKHATIVTGFWPGERQEHTQLWLHNQDFIQSYKLEFGEKAARDGLRQKMLVASFTQALAHATYLGFGPVTELTYPLVQQSAISDGQHWNLSVYQLNTSTLHSHLAQDNPRNNILWLSEEEKLFEAVEDGGVKGLNTSLLATIIAMYLKKGVPRDNPTPYLAPEKRLHQHPACEEYRENFLSFFHDVLSNRPRARLDPEIYLWEKIYKVDFKTRPMESPKRFFEDHYNKMDLGKRRLDDYPLRYIPKPIRKNKYVKYRPRVHSEHLYKYDDHFLIKKHYPDDER
ncbi:hypothetical protein Pmani_029168 [Petrolisthes manimaculis]|uniref:Ribosomal protein S30 n=1 Tax=Petrolisthes manimaculis TaxID=1843537 RepID=A0AAE1NZ88_9EUCA|nr:hypothetical protein Pmani_029168 [Petrolisthes manimaculis]